MSSLTKTCKICKEDKPLTDFYKVKIWCSSYCKVCNNEKGRRWSKENPEKKLEGCRSWRERNPGKGEFASWRSLIKGKYGITPEIFQNMLDKQNGVCVICGSGQLRNKTNRLCIDHIKGTKIVRGLLCDLCNKGLGHFKENIDIMNNAISYLRKHECQLST